MIFYMPTKVFHQDNCVVTNSALFASLGKKALVITGKSSSKNGALADLKEALEKENISYQIFDEVKENPPVSQVMKVRNQYKDSGIDFVIGLGGGSAMDASKAIALMLYYKDEDETFLYKGLPDFKCLPVVAIPTTCGTGSEVTGAAVLTREDKQTKQSISFKIFPKYALVDSKYIENLPHHILCNTSIDALGHLIESYVNPESSRYSEMIVFEGLRVWAKCKNALVSGKCIKEDLDNLMLSSTLAGMAIAHCGTSLPHGGSYVLTYNTGMPHGKAVGYFLYGYLKNADQKQINKVLELTGFESLAQFRDFIIKACDIKKVDDELLEKCVNNLISNKSKLSHCPYEINEAILRDIIFSI